MNLALGMVENVFLYRYLTPQGQHQVFTLNDILSLIHRLSNTLMLNLIAKMFTYVLLLFKYVYYFDHKYHTKA